MEITRKRRHHCFFSRCLIWCRDGFATTQRLANVFAGKAMTEASHPRQGSLLFFAEETLTCLPLPRTQGQVAVSLIWYANAGCHRNESFSAWLLPFLSTLAVQLEDKGIFFPPVDFSSYKVTSDLQNVSRDLKEAGSCHPGFIPVSVWWISHGQSNRKEVAEWIACTISLPSSNPWGCTCRLDSCRWQTQQLLSLEAMCWTLAVMASDCWWRRLIVVVHSSDNKSPSSCQCNSGTVLDPLRKAILQFV